MPRHDTSSDEPVAPAAGAGAPGPSRRSLDVRPEEEPAATDAQVARARREAAEPHTEPVHPGVPLAPPGIVPESDVRVHSPSSAAPQPAHGVVEGLGELPWMYGDARLACLVRDPATLFVYWDFSQAQIDQAFQGLGHARAVLKLWNVRSRSGELVRESEVHLETRGWYLRALPPNSELRAELWAVGERGQRLLRSARPVRLPPAAPSDQTEAFYLRLPLNQPLPRDGGQGRPLNYGGALPPDWDRRAQPRWSSASSPGGSIPGSPPDSMSGRLPWSGTHLLPDLERHPVPATGGEDERGGDE